MDAVCIVNPGAGGGTGPEDLAPALRILRSAGLKVEVQRKSAARGPGELARRAVAEGIQMVIAAGGDGTVAKVARELVGTKATLGILPYGTYMNIARSLGLPRHDVRGAARIVARGRARRIDSVTANGDLFFEAAGVGSDADVFRVVGEAERQRFVAAGRAFDTLLRRRPTPVRLEIDGAVHRHRALLVIVANAPYYGWGLHRLEDVRLDDGRLDVAVYDQPGWSALRELLGAVPAAAAAPAHRYRGARVTVTQPGSPAHADGDRISRGPFHFEVLPRSLRVFAPPARRMS